MSDLNIYQRMSAITTELGVVQKNLQIQATKTSSYKAVSERDVLDAVKPLEAKYGVYSYPHERHIVETETLENEREYNGTKTKVISKFIRIETVYRFVNIDKPEEFIEVQAYGDGIDTGDKSVGKCVTYSDKYALMKAYKISTGDDPDQEASPERGYDVRKTGITEGQKRMIIGNSKLISDELKELGCQTPADLESLTMNQASSLCALIKERSAR